eukprot:TRINITY_DN5493_c0_g2_i1.p1 TRINITY_DN5493_c0_g2~~TRINITY_DN5493_c0_g2_i1.p1  ORF type:complete len:464 (-),score=58.16 TRINITY_DN5493_c0_g2_i1:163-1554(-)
MAPSSQKSDRGSSGQAAALAGGTTMHIDFMLPGSDDILTGLARYHEMAGEGCSDYSFHVAITKWDNGVCDKMKTAVQQHGINSFKFYMAYKDGGVMASDEVLLNAFQCCKRLRALAMVHAENGDAVDHGRTALFDMGLTSPRGHPMSRPAVLEGEATGRAIRLASFVDTPLYVVHVMSRDAMSEVAAALLRGERVIGEPIVAGLAINGSNQWHPDFETAARFVMSPPLRSEEHRLALKNALAGGVLKLVGTDHAVWSSEQKALGRDDFRKIPNGINGVEERMHLVWDEMVNSGSMTPIDFVRVTSTAAAQIFNIYPRKGVIAEGADADVIVFDAAARHTIATATHHSRVDSNVFEGRRVRGRVIMTISRGRLVWVVHDGKGELRVAKGTSRFVHTPPGGSLFDTGQKQGGANVQSSTLEQHAATARPHEELQNSLTLFSSLESIKAVHDCLHTSRSSLSVVTQ